MDASLIIAFGVIGFIWAVMGAVAIAGLVSLARDNIREARRFEAEKKRSARPN